MLNPITRHQRIHPRGKEACQLAGLFALRGLTASPEKDEANRGGVWVELGADRKVAHARLLAR